MQTRIIKTPVKEHILNKKYRLTVCNPSKNEPATGIIIEGHFLMATFENKTML